MANGDPFREGWWMAGGSAPVVVVGAHVQGLFLDVLSVPREGETVLASSFEEPLDGGKSTNQAVAAARLGAPTALVTVVGTDERGTRAVEFFAGENIDVRGCFRLDGATDVGIVLLPPSRIPAIVSVLDRNLDLDGARVRSAGDIVGSASVVVCALEAPQEAAAVAFELAHKSGALTILNPAPAAELEPDLLAATDVLVPNEHEASVLAGREGSPSDLAGWLLRDLELRVVVVTAGMAGAFVAEQDADVVHLPAPTVDVVDTTGAGDAFIGAFAACLQRGEPVVAAAAFGVQAASISVTRSGTMDAFPSAVELARVTSPVTR
jgi:ribokinase